MINKEERDEFLAKLLDEKLYVPDFSMWEGFGKLFNFIRNQSWIYKFCAKINCFSLDEDDDLIDSCLPLDMIDPDTFADRVYEFLNKKE